MLLALSHDEPSSEAPFRGFRDDNVLARLETLDSRARRKGLAALDPKKNRLIPIGMEINERGRVTKNGYGVFHLSWMARRQPECASQIEEEVDAIRERIREAHHAPLRFLIWAGMGGSAEDKNMYNAAGLLKKGPRCYVLDSTDPSKLRHILADMSRRAGGRLAAALRSTLTVGMAMGMTSYEPVVNLEKLSRLYERHRIDSRPNFLYMTLPGSLLDQFAGPRGYRKVELQPDGGNSTAGRHSGPLTRGSLYPLGLAEVDLRSWMAATFLAREDIMAAWRLAAFLDTQGRHRRDKVTLLLPRPWEGAGLWTKQDFEESLGKSEELGIKIVIGERPKLANYRPPKDPRQDRVFLAVVVPGLAGPDRGKLGAVRRAGYPLAVLTLPRGTQLAAYMQFIHYSVFGMAWLRNMNFVTQPSVELYKSITGKLHVEAEKAGGIKKSREWRRMMNSPHLAAHRGGVKLFYEHVAALAPAGRHSAASIYAGILASLAGSGAIEYAELTFFGDTRYDPKGRAVRRRLEQAAERVFRARLKMPADIYEGPAMNHSYHEMIIGHGRALSTVVISDTAESIPEAGYDAGYHRAQFLATQQALAQRRRPAVAILLRDLEENTLEALSSFFSETAALLKSLRR